MQISKTNADILFIGNDIEARVVFGNAFSNLDKALSVSYFFDAENACKFIEGQNAKMPEYVFLNAGTNISQCMADISAVSGSVNGHDCTIVVYDTHSILQNTIGIYSMGAHQFVYKPYDFRGLKRALPGILATKTNEEMNVNLSLGN